VGKLVLIFFLIIISAAFSSFETALFSLTPVQLRRLEKGGSFFSLISKILQKPREFLTTVLLGNEVMNVAISILAGALAYDWMQGAGTKTAYILSTAVTTLVILIVGEIIPKNIAVRVPVIVAEILMVPYQLFAWFVYPFRIFFSKIADWIVRLFGADPRKGRRLLVEEELRTLLELGKKEGTLADLERVLIQNALDFSDKQVSEAMTPREKIVAVSVDSQIDQVFKTIEANHFSRLPVYENDFHIIGIIHAKELLLYRRRPESVLNVPLKNLVKPIFQISPEATLDILFQKFQELRIHMALVCDNTDSVVGLITLDDLLRRFFHNS